ncbi:GyrI-like domain-containing protein [Senegalia massiliensis]|uniref:AraC family transcriptional regulator n=1 Tax=Senegalia massiliensis TaxID=1720316 RepID=A0A845QV55_9CLOT|nr:GyrI-like domain-containing protein [Senegalia massiliensis]NBI06121.1 AraC family transcriptional regulator [Senegalia massiliensis]
MEITKCIKKSFSVIGKEGSTNEGKGFIQKLWADANSNFAEVSPLAKKDESGNLLGIWGAMSDLSRSFNPWEDNFTKGLYLAGVEVIDNAQAPQGWMKWTIPSYEYIYVKNESQNTFTEVIEYLKENNIKLIGAAHDYTCPEDGQEYIFFPIRRV